MSNLPGNPYVERLVSDGAPRTAESLATLALAYEQRTANLIAFMEYAEGDSCESQWQVVTERLGLGETNE